MNEVVIPSRIADLLTPSGATVLRSNASKAYRDLVPRGRGTHAKLERIITPGELLAAPVESPADAECVLSGLWLWQDCLDRSHTISQSISTESGSFWHAIMHRREGDFSNAKYWYARCRHHPARDDLSVLVESMLATESGYRGAERFIRSGWDSDAFVDLVQEVHCKPDDVRHGLAVRLQQLEWMALFEHCALAAAGRR